MENIDYEHVFNIYENILIIDTQSENDNKFINPILILKQTKLFTKIGMFLSKNNNISSEYLFDNNFPNIMQLLSKCYNFNLNNILRVINSHHEDIKLYNTVLCTNADDHLRITIENNYPLIEEDINKIFEFEWSQLNLYYLGSTKIHTLCALLFVYLDINFCLDIKIYDYDKNILYWAILLHDISKHVVLNKYSNENFDYTTKR
jgi:hypothetical protein